MSCEPISYSTEEIEYVENRTGTKDRVLFLTDKELSTKKGKDISNPNSHGEIADYFQPTGKIAKQTVSDMSEPANFPAPIAQAIKAGKMTRALESVDVDYLAENLLSEKAASRVKDHKGLWKLFTVKGNRAQNWK